MTRGYGGYSPEVRQEAAAAAIALVGEGMSAMRACQTVAGEIGCHAHSVRTWAREVEPNFGRALRTSEVPEEVQRLREEVNRLRKQVRAQTD